MAPWLFLVASIVGALATTAALLPGRRLSYAAVPYFFVAWLTGELALHHIAWQAVATAAFVYCGALAGWPGWLGMALTLASWAGLAACQHRSAGAREVFQRALREGLGEVPGPELPPVSLPLHPFRFHRPSIERIRNLSYGDAGRRNCLDLYRSRLSVRPAPVLLQIHGGGWTIGQKEQQGLPLMYHMAERGWICVAINYRLSPRATFPDHIVDVKRALAWIRKHGAAYGADPGFVIVTGGSAGGHLAALTALTANEPTFQPGFEDADTSVAGCVPFYGVYDLLDRNGFWGRGSLRPFLQKAVLKCSPVEHRDRWEEASPLDRIHPDAPPFFVIHGTHDSLVPVEEARNFVARLREVSRNAVVYAEIPGAQHAFDIFHSVRSRYAVLAVERFCRWVRLGLTATGV